MSDITKTKYAEFLEDVCKIIMAYKPKAVAVEYVCHTGDIGCVYFDCSMCDKMAMAGMMQFDATWEGISANPERLRDVLENEDTP